MVGDPQFTYCMQQDEPWGVIAPLGFDPCLNWHMAKDEVEKYKLHKNGLRASSHRHPHGQKK